ncbi:hypothetical protein [Pseudotenacibaculum haliotis]|uniref:Uncharacterized protein n=1 Tax=Pseudotenacibaculum haliotis TaxID=1862138 RepID=A0ABW5LP49_9FLAO
MEELLLEHLGELLTGVVALLLGWFGKEKVSKKKQNVDLTAQIQGVYREMIADTEAKLEEQDREIKALKAKQLEIDESWKKKIAAVEKKWQGRYNRLKNEFDQYKKNHQ